MRLAFAIQQNVSRFNVSMENAVFMRIMHCARYPLDEFCRLPDRYWPSADHFLKLAAFDERHAEVARAIALAHFVDWNDAGMIETGRGFRLPTKAFHVRFTRPLTKADDF